MLASMLLACLPGLSDDDVWGSFRGPGGRGCSPDAEVPVSWSEDEHVAWKVAVPGAAWSAPVTAGDAVFVTTAISETAPKPLGFADGVKDPRSFGAGGKTLDEKVTFQVRAYGLEDGEARWVQTVAVEQPPHPTHPSNTFATETPVTDGEALYVSFMSIGLVLAMDLDGTELWRTELGTYPMTADFGTGASLAACGDFVFMVSDNSEESFLVALDKEDGGEVWRADRPTGSAWATPAVWQHAEGTELVACGSGAVTSYDPESGDVLWCLEGISGSFSSSPACDEGRFYCGNSGPGSPGPLLAIKAGTTGTLELGRTIPEELAWYKRGEGPGFSSPLAIEGLVYVAGSRGSLSCYDADTGERIYRERLPECSSIAASLIAVAGHVVVLEETGRAFVVPVGREFELAHVNELDDLFWSTPSVAGDRLLIRGAEHLYCLGASD